MNTHGSKKWTVLHFSHHLEILLIPFRDSLRNKTKPHVSNLKITMYSLIKRNTRTAILRLSATRSNCLKSDWSDFPNVVMKKVVFIILQSEETLAVNISYPLLLKQKFNH